MTSRNSGLLGRTREAGLRMAFTDRRDPPRKARPREVFGAIGEVVARQLNPGLL
jgi:hypothetical protein